MAKSNFKRVLSMALSLVLCVSLLAAMAISSSAEAEVPTTPIHQIDVPAEDGVYFAQVDLMNATSNQPSMGNASLRGSSTYKTKQPGDTDYYKAIVIVKDHKATAIVEFMPMGYIGMVGFLMELEGTVPDYLQQWGGIYDATCQYTPTQTLVTHSTLEGKAIYDNYNDPSSSQAFNGTQMRPAGYGHATERPLNIVDQAYSHVVAVDVTPITTGDDPVPTAAEDYIWKNAAYVHVFVPVMYSIMPTSGDQHARLKVDWTTMEKIEKPEENVHYQLWAAKQIKADGYTAESYNALQTSINEVSSKLSNIWPVQKLNMIGSGMNAMPELCQIEYTADEKLAMANTLTTAIANLEPEGTAPVEPSAPLTFKGANLVLESNISINYFVDKDQLDAAGYVNPTLDVEFNGKTTNIVPEVRQMGAFNVYAFTFKNIAAKQLVDDAVATLKADFNGVEYKSEPLTYGANAYCYNQLAKDKTSASTKTMIVDLLNYAASAQELFGYKADNLVNAALTEAQKALGTQHNPAIDNITNPSYNVIPDAVAAWKGASLTLVDSVQVNFIFTANDISNLSVKVVDGNKSWVIPASEFTAVDAVPNGYSVNFSKLTAAQMRDNLEVTVYSGDVAVSNTLLYSIESFAAMKAPNGDALAKLVLNMIKYGDAAAAL